MTVWQTEKLANLLAVSIGGIWGEEAGKAEEDVAIVRVTELKAHGRIDPSSAVTRSVTLKQLASRELQEGDLLLEKSGGGPNSPVGRVGYFFQEGTRTVCSNFMQLMRPDSSKVLPKYLFYFLDGFHSNGGTISMQTATTNIRNIKMPQYMDIDVPLPTLEEQRKIVELLEDHLSRFETALADLKQAKVKAAQFRRSLLQTTFTGNLVSDGAIPFTEWQRKTVGEIADTQLGKMLNKGKQSGNYAKPYLRTDNVHWGKFDLSEIKEMDILPEEQDKYLAIKGDLLMCEGGASGRTAIWNEDYDISFQNHVHRIRPKNPKEILPKYLLYYFEWFIKNGYASDLIKGVTISSLSQSGLRSIAVVFPPIDEQHRIIENLEGHLSRLEASVSLADVMEKQSNGLRRSILQAAFTGQLTKEVVSV
jgi:type I restriction enzyme S subunit